MKRKRASVSAMCLVATVALIMQTAQLQVMATEGVGVAAVTGGSGVKYSEKELAKAEQSAEAISESAMQKADSTITESVRRDSSDLVMANVSKAMNVRSDPSEKSKKVGVLYKDCGGKVLDHKDGWTKIQSGDLIGWAKDDYLLFKDDARKLASEVGSQVITVTADALYVRSKASTSSKSLGVLTKNDQLDMIKDLGNGWYSVDFDDTTAYVQSDFVIKDFRIDTGETVVSIQKRKEGAEKANRKANRGAVMADADETRLLAALIQCEAGNQSYEGKVAVGAVVMNRVRSAAYPNTIQDVIYASGQFTPALNGKVARVYNKTVNPSCIKAAQDALAGNTTVGGATHFKRVGLHHGGFVLGDHVFW
ncbi:cell wall hydrolase [Butyrivibrio sp. NC3005]|uniref:cell wall hydrolase n=1 Tax=Butyrivibrio sp. NC3005 TaxID=1280685 RepID=UPI00042697BF|nr:cell wall hydrolase [Butyrivibrio sp. NC3005]